MKRIGFLGWLFLALALFGAFVLTMYGRVIRAAWNAGGESDKAKANKADLDKAIEAIEAREKAGSK